MAVKHKIQEIVLVVIITVISISVALFIANNAQSEPLLQKDNQLHHHSEDRPIINSTDSGNIRTLGAKLKMQL